MRMQFALGAALAVLLVTPFGSAQGLYGGQGDEDPRTMAARISAFLAAPDHRVGPPDVLQTPAPPGGGPAPLQLTITLPGGLTGTGYPETFILQIPSGLDASSAPVPLLVVWPPNKPIWQPTAWILHLKSKSFITAYSSPGNCNPWFGAYLKN